ncbi:MAG: hypothetical protein M1813_008960 [Trichoglossum hirsutum]|nr:MAG: hypothetical protein M1813_008960 [Trichoglossum hirsutum]
MASNNAETILTKEQEGRDPGHPLPTTTAAVPPFPFLSLPVELRKLIYRHLIPNATVPTWTAGTKRPPMRDDGRPCSPAILFLNRTIYQEVFEEWYGSAVYEVDFQADGMHFLDQVIPLDGTPPSTFRAVRSMRVNASLTNRPRNQKAAYKEDHKGCMVALAEWLSPMAGPNRLQWLYLHVSTWPPYFARRIGKPDEIRQGLAWNLNPLRAIRGLSKVHADIVVPTYLGQMMGFSERFIKGKTEHLAIAREFIDEMESEMVQMPQDQHVQRPSQTQSSQEAMDWMDWMKEIDRLDRLDGGD